MDKKISMATDKTPSVDNKWTLIGFVKYLVDVFVRFPLWWRDFTLISLGPYYETK